jgi:hypothetical protein
MNLNGLRRKDVTFEKNGDFGAEIDPFLNTWICIPLTFYEDSLVARSNLDHKGKFSNSID